MCMAHAHIKIKMLPGDDQMPPFSVAYVKGWRRSLACLICCEAVRTLGISLEELTSEFKAWSIIGLTWFDRG